jgi:hypothetical protein
MTEDWGTETELTTGVTRTLNRVNQWPPPRRVESEDGDNRFFRNVSNGLSRQQSAYFTGEGT